MTDKNKIREEFDNFKSAYKNLESMTEGMSEEELELVHKIQAVLAAHEEVLEEAAVNIMAAESNAEEPVEEAPAEEAPDKAADRPLPVPPVGNPRLSLADRIAARYIAWKPGTGIGRWIRRDRHNAVLLAVMVIFALVMGVKAVDYAIPENVTVALETVTNFEEEDLETRAATVGEVLAESSLDIAESDLVYPGRDMPVSDGMQIRVRHATNAKAMIGGKKTDVLIVPGTVEDNLLINDIAYDDDDIIKPELSAKITEDTKLVVDYVDYEVRDKTEKVKARSVVRLDPKLKSGVEEKVKGHNGKAVFEYRTKYVNGKKKGTEKVVKRWIKKVQDNELRLGTSLTGHKGEFIVEDEFTGNTTAYWMGNNARGASGGRCVYGTCAVDPKRIPYGTDMWIEGYGYAVANDCGGAIKNDHVDLWMHSYKESCQWGRRFVTVYVMKPAKASK